MRKQGKCVRGLRKQHQCITFISKNARKKLGSKIVQVKGVMPKRHGITRQTPTGRAVGRYKTWHNVIVKSKQFYAIKIMKYRDLRKCKQKKVMP